MNIDVESRISPLLSVVHSWLSPRREQIQHEKETSLFSVHDRRDR
jgi:hypothetical protein